MGDKKQKGKKIAICLYGKVGSILGKCDRIQNDLLGNEIMLDLSYLHWEKYIINANRNYKIDFYIHSWDNTIREKIVNKFKPVKYVIVKQKTDFKIPCQYIFRYASRYYSMKRVCNLIENRDQYDYIMLSRIDISFTEPICFEKLNKNNFYVPLNLSKKKLEIELEKFNSHKNGMNFFSFSESYYIATPDNIYQLSLIYDYLINICREYNKINIHTEEDCGYLAFSKELKKNGEANLDNFSREKCIKLMVLINECLYNRVVQQKKLTDFIPKFDIKKKNIIEQIESLKDGKKCLNSDLVLCLRYTGRTGRGSLNCPYCNQKCNKIKPVVWSSHWLTSSYIYNLCYKNNTKLNTIGPLLNYKGKSGIHRPINMYFRSKKKHPMALIDIKEYLKKKINKNEIDLKELNKYKVPEGFLSIMDIVT